MNTLSQSMGLKQNDVSNQTFNSKRSYVSNSRQFILIKYIYLLIFLVCISTLSIAQNVGIGTDSPQAKLDISSTNEGLLIPRVALSATNATTPITDPTIGELVFNTASSGTGDSAVSIGFYFWNGSSWVRLLGGDVDEGHNWYQAETTSPATSINDNIYTNGNVGIGVTNPTERLSVYSGQNASAEIGDAHLGHMGHNNLAGFSHVDVNNTTDYALLQNANGQTLLNSAEGEDILIRNNNSTNASFKSNGDVGIGTGSPSSKLEVIGDIRLNGDNAGIIYETTKGIHKDWRLIYISDFENNTDGWIGNGSLSTGDAGTTRQFDSSFGIGGYFLRPVNNNHTLKKSYDMSGITFTEIKIEFNYLFIDSWDTESGWFSVKDSEDDNGEEFWYKQHNTVWSDMERNGSTYISSFFGSTSYSDCKYAAQAQFSTTGSFWVEFGANLNSAISDETFGIDNIHVYVR